MPRPHRLVPVLLSIVLVGGVGCESSQKAASLDQALLDYQAGKYALAHDQASHVMAKENGPERSEAAYLAGLSAYRTGDMADAERRLLAATRAADEELAAKAHAQLGLVHLSRREPNQAARWLEQSTADLEGHDRREAARFAAMAHRQAGNAASARRWETIARQTITPATPPAATKPATTARRTGGPGYVLQVGAFSNRRGAEKAASTAAPRAQRAGFGDVRIVPKADSLGRWLYFVQLGEFSSKVEAATAKRRLGEPGYLVVPIAQ